MWAIPWKCDGAMNSRRALEQPAAEFLLKNGFKDAYNMTDGIFGWNLNWFQVVRRK